MSKNLMKYFIKKILFAIIIIIIIIVEKFL